MRAKIAVLAVLMLALGALASRAEAQSAADATCQVYEIEASNADGGIDKGLGPIERKLVKPPFNTWKTYKLLAKHEQDVERKKPLELPLKIGGRMNLLLRDKVTEKGKKPRLRLSVTMQDKSGKIALETTTLADSGDAWLIAGQPMPSKKDATYVLGILCTAK